MSEDWSKWLTEEERWHIGVVNQQCKNGLPTDPVFPVAKVWDFARSLAASREENIEIKAERGALKLVLNLRTIEHAQDHEEVDKLEVFLAASRALVTEMRATLNLWEPSCPGCGERHLSGHHDTCACDHCPFVERALALTETDILERLEVKA